MSGPQFFHLQSFSRKANPAGQSVEQVLAEAGRVPRFSTHVTAPRPPRVVAGLHPARIKERHDAMVEAGRISVTLADGSTKEITLRCRIDTAVEIDYIKNGGVLHYVLRNLAQSAA